MNDSSEYYIRKNLERIRKILKKYNFDNSISLSEQLIEERKMEAIREEEKFNKFSKGLKVAIEKNNLLNQKSKK